jgi:hypothetical protein
MADEYQRERALYELLSRVGRDGKLMRPDFVGMASAWQRYGVDDVVMMQAVVGAQSHAATVAAVKVWAEDAGRQLLIWDAVELPTASAAEELERDLHRAKTREKVKVPRRESLTIDGGGKSVTVTAEGAAAALAAIERRARGKRSKQAAVGGEE